MVGSAYRRAGSRLTRHRCRRGGRNIVPLMFRQGSGFRRCATRTQRLLGIPQRFGGLLLRPALAIQPVELPGVRIHQRMARLSPVTKGPQLRIPRRDHLIQLGRDGPPGSGSQAPWRRRRLDRRRLDDLRRGLAGRRLGYRLGWRGSRRVGFAGLARLPRRGFRPAARVHHRPARAQRPAHGRAHHRPAGRLLQRPLHRLDGRVQKLPPRILRDVRFKARLRPLLQRLLARAGQGLAHEAALAAPLQRAQHAAAGQRANEAGRRRRLLEDLIGQHVRIDFPRLRPARQALARLLRQGLEHRHIAGLLQQLLQGSRRRLLARLIRRQRPGIDALRPAIGHARGRQLRHLLGRLGRHARLAQPAH